MRKQVPFFGVGEDGWLYDEKASVLIFFQNVN